MGGGGGIVDRFKRFVISIGLRFTAFLKTVKRLVYRIFALIF